MSRYGTIPTSPSPSPSPSLSDNLHFVSRAKERIKSGLVMRRPWHEMIQLPSLTIPKSVGDAFQRVRTNVAYFRMNYVIVLLLILFLSLLWHPISLIVFVIMMAAWLFFYFMRNEPLVLFGLTINDRVVLAVLSVLTLLFLFLTGATVNILVALLVGVVVILVHAVFRSTEDLYAVDGSATGPGAGGGYARLPLKDTASSSFSH